MHILQASLPQGLCSIESLPRLNNVFHLFMIRRCRSIEDHGVVEHGLQVCLHNIPGRVFALSQFATHLSKAHGSLDHC